MDTWADEFADDDFWAHEFDDGLENSGGTCIPDSAYESLFEVEADADEVDLNKDWEPYVGKIFDTEEEAYQFYNSYALKFGFSVRRGRVYRTGEAKLITSRFYYYSKEGLKDKNDKRKNPDGRSLPEVRTSVLIY